MDKFIVSARKYRPQNFSTVVGQEHITTTLKNAIRNNQLAHAFLFCGPRGVGKTTCARILAKTINCENLGKNGEACNKCQSCVSFNDGGSMNIHELDAASNNSVDDIRSLVEQVRFAPQAGKYKVYIIDEVHMLSSSAFNAFLKTLEEPPSYAIFILATTEKHKILPTILSRCQIFDFKRITLNDTVEHLQDICNKEEVGAEKAALQVIAQKSEGCMRDALSILDKIVSFTNGEVSYQNTLEHLNILDADYYFKMIEGMRNQDLATLLLLYDDINRKGFEGDLVLTGFMEFLRNLLVCKDEKVAGLLEVVEAFKAKYTSTAAQLPAAYLISCLNVLNEAEIHYKSARNKKLHVELALIKLCYLQQALELSARNEDVTKKKITESVTALAYRQLPIVEDKRPGAKPAVIEKGSRTELKQSEGIPEPEARLTIETPSEKVTVKKTENPKQTGAEIIHCDIDVNMQPEEVAVAKVKSTLPASGALSKIRQQYSKMNGSATAVVVKTLTDEDLLAAWNNFAQALKDAKNPSYQSFERASLRILNNNLFEVVTGNNLEQKFIDQQRLRLCEHLQEWFNNRALSYQIIITENPGSTQQAEPTLNSREQYLKLIEQYPLVKELKERLKLALDY